MWAMGVACDSETRLRKARRSSPPTGHLFGISDESVQGNHQPLVGDTAMLCGMNLRRHPNGMHHSACVKTMTLGEGLLALQRFGVELAHLESLGAPVGRDLVLRETCRMKM